MLCVQNRASSMLLARNADVDAPLDWLLFWRMMKEFYSSS
jgi:hypothetical protein